MNFDAMEKLLFNLIPTNNEHCLFIWNQDKTPNGTYNAIAVPNLNTIAVIFWAKECLIPEGNIIITTKDAQIIEIMKQEFLIGHFDVIDEWTFIIGTKI